MPRSLVHFVLLGLLWFGLGWMLDANAQSADLPSYHVVVADGRFAPARIEVPAGMRIRLTLQNDGPGPLEFENDEMHIEKILAVGASSFVVLPRLQPGEYSFVDEFNPITGELIVIAK